MQEYSKKFLLTFDSKVEYHYDNLDIVDKINTLAANLSNHDEQYKTIDHDVVLKLRE